MFLLSYAFVWFQTRGKEDLSPQVAEFEQSPVEIRAALPVGSGSMLISSRGFAPLAELDAEAFERRIALGLASLEVFPGTGGVSDISFLWPADDSGEAVDEEALAFAGRSRFEEWIPFEDDLVGFYLPGREISVESTSGLNDADLLAPMFLPSYADAERVYLLKHGERTVAAVIVTAANSFDDGPRFPRPQVFHRYLFQNGAFARYSFIEEGAVRGAQILAGDYRMTVMDWPHCRLHQDVYRQLALSMHLKQPPVREAEMRELVVAKYGFPGKLGLIGHGASESELVELLGEPDGRADDLRSYVNFTLRGDRHYRLRVEDGVFVEFPPDWNEERRDPPAPFSLGWMLEKSETEAGRAGAVGYSLGALTDEEARGMFDQFLELAPTAPSDEWDVLCRMIANLAEKGLKDNRVVDVIRSRFLDTSLPQQAAGQVLRVYGVDEHREYFADRLRQILSETGAWRVNFGGDFFSGNASPDGLVSEIQILFAYVGKEYSTMPLLVKRATEHRRDEVRSIGHGYVHWLELTKAVELVQQGLADPSANVRRRCAEFCATASEEFAAVLKPHVEQAIESEADVLAKNYLLSAVGRGAD
ncbi:MAG: hypothetical protein AAGA58_17310 [Verrucomicrobiota bacterium]